MKRILLTLIDTIDRGTIACNKKNVLGLVTSWLHSDRIQVEQYNVEFREREVWADTAIRTTNTCVKSRYSPYQFGLQNSIPEFRKEPMFIQNKIPKADCNNPCLERFGRTGEPRECVGLHLEGQRIRSTRLPERELVTGKRFLSTLKEKESTPQTQRGVLPEELQALGAAGKGSKSTHIKHTVKQMVGVAYSNSIGGGTNAGPDGLGESLSTSISRLDTLWKMKDNTKVYGLWKLVADINMWITAYKKLAPNPGSMTKGGAGGTIDGISLKTLKALRDQVISEEFRFAKNRVHIPKGEHRVKSLGSPEFQDRCIQEVVRTILQAIYEPHLSDNSHGFQSSRSQHTCLTQVQRDFTGTVWYIEGDISKSFDSIHHGVIMKILKRRIQDHKFLNLVQKGLQNWQAPSSGKAEWTIAATPQTGICTPLICNIVLHELDMFILRLKRIVDTGKTKRVNPEYATLKTLIQKSHTLGDRYDIRKHFKQRRLLPYTQPGSLSMLRIHSVRFHENFLIGIDGPHLLAKRIQHLVSRFLEVGYKLKESQHKTVISKATDKIPFLGYLINHAPLRTFTYQRTYAGNKRRIEISRAGNIRLLVDTRKVISHLAEKRFCDNRGEPLPNFNYLSYPQSFTVSRCASLLRLIDNYYQLADNRRAVLSRISYIVRYSLAKMFAAKFRVHSKAIIFKKGGKDLSKPLLKSSTVASCDEQLIECKNKSGGDLRNTLIYPLPNIMK